MSVERFSWVDVSAWDRLNERLRRAFDITDMSARVGCVNVAVNTKYDPPVPDTLVLVDTQANTVLLELPPVQAAVGYRIEVVLWRAGHALTVQAFGSDVIQGGASNSWSTVNQSLRYVSTGRLWRQLT